MSEEQQPQKLADELEREARACGGVMSEEQQPQKLADELEREARSMSKQGDKLDAEIDEVRKEWERKRADASVPGAPSREESPADEGSEPEKT